MKIVTIDQMRTLEADAVAGGISLDRLMENAGQRVAQRASELLDGKPKGEHVLVLVGPGNNGRDGMVAARHLDEWGARVHVFLCATRPAKDLKLEALREHVVDIVDMANESAGATLGKALGSVHLVIDALLGAAHLRRPIEGPMRAALEAVQAAKERRRDLLVLALDVPSGLDADTGACDPATPVADVTVTLGYPKAGLFQFPGAGRVGRLVVEDIGIPEASAAKIEVELLDAPWVSSRMPKRPLDANKGTFGSVLVLAGSSKFIGAAALACAAAVRAGAGKVTLATPRSLVPIIASMVPEVTYIPFEETGWGIARPDEAAKQVLDNLPAYDTLLVGCGVGQTPEAGDMVQRVLFGITRTSPPRLVIDADALNILSHVPDWWRRVHGDIVVTPHPGEMARLTGQAGEQIQSNRVNAARDASRAWDVTVLLKGAYTVIATPDGRVSINPFANPALASAGTGDVLSGTIAGLMAQGLNSELAAAAGAYIHAAAAELRRAEIGDSGLAASDLLPLIPGAMRKLRG